MPDLTTDYRSPSVPEILDTMKSLSKNKSKIFFFGSEADYGVILYDQCTQKQIEELEKYAGYSLPEDYRQFLLYTNGMMFGQDGSPLSVSSRIYSLEELYSVKKILDWQLKSMLEIGVCADGTIQIFINLKEKGSNNIYIAGIMDDKYYSRLNCDFRTFLERFILAYGVPFWEWGAEMTDICHCEAEVERGPTYLGGAMFLIGD